MSEGSERVVVIGAGVIGAACAYYLRRSGRDVLVIDAGLFGRGCSHANCGLISPSHVLPLTEPGAVLKVLKALLHRNSPLVIRWRFDPGLWWWFWKFARRCNMPDMLAAGEARQALLRSSLSLFRELLAAESIACEWEERGLLLPFRSAEALEEYGRTCDLLREKFGERCTRYDGEALVQLEPALKSDLAGAWYFEEDAHLRPDRLLLGWRQVLERHGVEIMENCKLEGFHCDGGRARAIQTTQGTIAGAEFVVATGAWTPLLSKQLRCRIPIQPGKGYSITMPRPSLCPRRPMIFLEWRVAVTPMQSAYRLGSTMEFAGYDSRLRPARLELLKEGASRYLRQPYMEPFEEQWYGWRPMTYDGVPIIDRTPAMSNVYIAAGHNMLGLSMAPATGKLVAELVQGQTPHVDPAPYRLSRF